MRFGLAFMVVFRIRLDSGTVMIATIALGLVVDDTCHFLVRLRQRTRMQESLPEAIAETMRQTGRPIILTSVILVLGFAVLTLGSFTPTVCFGLVCSFVVTIARTGLSNEGHQRGWPASAETPGPTRR